MGYILELITKKGKVETNKYYSSRIGKIRNKTKQRKDSLKMNQENLTNQTMRK